MRTQIRTSRVTAGFLIVAPVSALVVASVRPGRVSALTPSGPYRGGADNRDCTLILHRVSVFDGRPGEHVWQIGDNRFDDFGAYASLYSPKLRQIIGHLPKGAIIGEEFSPADGVWTQQKDPDERERRDFAEFCKAHGVVFAFLPTA